MSEPPPLDDDAPPTLADLWEILRLPLLLALAAIAATWLVWYLTSASCTLELAQTTGCNPSRAARYINLTALNNMATHAVLAGGGGGLWSYRMITRERKAREYLAKQLAEERERNAEERERYAEERAQAAEERRQADARIAEERRQADERRAEEQRQADERRAEERRQADERNAEERRQFAETLQSIMQQMGEERTQAAQERAQAAQERAQAAEERRQSMSLIEDLRRQLADRQNGANGSTSQ